MDEKVAQAPYSSVSIFVNLAVQVFDLLWSPILTPPFQPCVTIPISHIPDKSPPHWHTIVPVTLSSVKLCLSLSTLDCSCVSWNENLLQACHVPYTFIKHLYFIKNKHSCFLCTFCSIMSFLLLFH
jgi:hypothetical protein